MLKQTNKHTHTHKNKTEAKQKTTRLIEKEIRLVVTRGGGLGERELEEGVQKVQTSSYKVNKYRDVIHNRMTLVSSAV